MPIKNHIPGIYCIACLPNNKKYIGQTKSTTTRWGQHKSDLKCHKHGNKILQDDYDLYGLSNFKFSVLEECDIKIIGDERETYWIAFYDSTNQEYGYNHEHGGIHTYTRSKETKMKLSKANKGHIPFMKGKKHTEESKAKMSKSQKGRVSCFKGKKHTEESKLKNSLANIGRISPMKGRKHTDEAKLKNSIKHLGKVPGNKGIPMTQEQKDKWLLANKGRTPPNKGKPMSEEQKEKLKKAWVLRKLKAISKT